MRTGDTSSSSRTILRRCWFSFHFLDLSFTSFYLNLPCVWVGSWQSDGVEATGAASETAPEASAATGPGDFVSKMMRFVSKVMKFVSKMMNFVFENLNSGAEASALLRKISLRVAHGELVYVNFVLKVMNFALKVMNFALKVMNFVLKGELVYVIGTVGSGKSNLLG